MILQEDPAERIVHRPALVSPKSPSLTFAELEPTLLKASAAILVGSRTMKVDDLRFIKFLGKGASGQVHLAKDTISKGTLAIKVVRKEGKDEHACQALMREKETLQLLEGIPFLCSLEASWSDSLNFYIAMVCCPSADDIRGHLD